MARAYDPNALDPELRLKKKFDDAWLADLELIRQLTEEEKQAEDDRALAARFAGMTIDPVSDERRKMAMLLEDFDDDQPQKSLPPATNTFHRSKP